MEKLKQPNNQKAEVLYLLIENRYMTRHDFSQYMIQNSPARVLEIRKMGIDIQADERPMRNKFGRISKPVVYYLSDVDHAILNYDKVNKIK